MVCAKLALWMAAAVAGTLIVDVKADDKPLRFGVTVAETSNSAGVIISEVADGSPASKLRRVSDDQPLKLETNKHAVTHVNGTRVTNSTEFLAAIASAPQVSSVRVYEYESKLWEDYVAVLRGEPTVVAAPPQQVLTYEPQYQYQYTTEDDNQPRSRRSSDKKKGGLFSTKHLAQGDDWRTGDPVWLFQKKPTDPDLKKAYNQQMTVEIIMGVAAGLDEAVDGLDSYHPSTPSSMGSHGSGRSNLQRDLQRDIWKAQSQQRYEQNKSDWLRSLPR